MITNNEIAKWWDTCSEVLSHTSTDKNTTIYNDYLKTVLSLHPINFKNKTVIDYGIGNAQLYPILSEPERGIKKYIGIDVSDRSLQKAKQFIIQQKLPIPYELLKTPQIFKDFDADILISLAVLQHFPSEEYSIEFFKNINESGIPLIFLQIRYGNEVSFKDDYSEQNNVVFSSRMNNDFILKHLTNYTNIFESDVNEKKVGWRGGFYQYLQYRIK